jgi:hypothetical protein
LDVDLPTGALKCQNRHEKISDLMSDNSVMRKKLGASFGQ